MWLTVLKAGCAAVLVGLWLYGQYFKAMSATGRRDRKAGIGTFFGGQQYSLLKLPC